VKTMLETLFTDGNKISRKLCLFFMKKISPDSAQKAFQCCVL
jgi:hypothetical protein